MFKYKCVSLQCSNEATILKHTHDEKFNYKIQQVRRFRQGRYYFYCNLLSSCNSGANKRLSKKRIKFTIIKKLSTMKNNYPEGAQYSTSDKRPTFYKYNEHNVLVFWSAHYTEWKASNLKTYQKEALIEL